MTLLWAAGLGAGNAGPVLASQADQPAPSGTSASASARHALAASYLRIADAGNRQLEADFGRLEGRDGKRLAQARADLREAAATERLFDQRLLLITFPPHTELVARDLYRANQARAALTSGAAASGSLRQVHASLRRLSAANRLVERAVTTIRRRLGLPAPSTS